MMRGPTFLAIVYLTLGWFGLEMAMALDASQFQILLDMHVKKAFWIGTILNLGPLCGITVQPIVGLLADMLTHRGLSRRPLMGAGIVMGIVSILGLSKATTLPMLVTLIALFFIGLNTLIVSYRATVTEVSGRRALNNHKGAISGYVAFFSGLGPSVMFLLGSFLTGTPYLFWLTAAIFGGTFALFFAYAPRTKRVPSQKSETETLGALHLLRPINLAFYAVPLLALFPAFENRLSLDKAQKNIFRLFLVLFFTWFGVQALRIYFVLFVGKSLAMGYHAAHLFLAVVTLVIVMSAIPQGHMADRYDNGALLRWTLLGFVITTGVSFFLVHGPLSLFLVCILLGIGFSGLITYSLSILMKLCPPKSEGGYSGLFNFFISVPQLYSQMITGFLIDYYHDYRMIFVVAAITMLMAFLLTFRFSAIPALSHSKGDARSNAQI